MNEQEHLHECIDQLQTFANWIKQTIASTPNGYRHIVPLQNAYYMLRDNVNDLENLLPRKEEQE